MDSYTATEHCSCGAHIMVRSDHWPYVEKELQLFRDAHVKCREVVKGTPGSEGQSRVRALEATLQTRDEQLESYSANEHLHRERIDEMESALEAIAAHRCTGIGSPPSCACRTCIAQRALNPFQEQKP